LGAILGRFSGTGRAVLCAKRKEIETAFDSRSIAPESLHEAMFREHLSGLRAKNYEIRELGAQLVQLRFNS
jgi:hypothetical protein